MQCERLLALQQLLHSLPSPPGGEHVPRRVLTDAAGGAAAAVAAASLAAGAQLAYGRSLSEELQLLPGQ